MALRRRSRSRAWFEAKVKALADLVRALPRPRQRVLFDALDASDEPGARESTDRQHHSENSECDDGAKNWGC